MPRSSMRFHMRASRRATVHARRTLIALARSNCPRADSPENGEHGAYPSIPSRPIATRVEAYLAKSWYIVAAILRRGSVVQSARAGSDSRWLVLGWRLRPDRRTRPITRRVAAAWQRQAICSPRPGYLIAFAGPRYPSLSRREALAAWIVFVRVAPTEWTGGLSWARLYYDGDLRGMRDAPARAADAFRHAAALDSAYGPSRRMLTAARPRRYPGVEAFALFRQTTIQPNALRLFVNGARRTRAETERALRERVAEFRRGRMPRSEHRDDRYS